MRNTLDRRRAGVAIVMAACAFGGCSVERLTVVEGVEGGIEDGGVTAVDASIEAMGDASADAVVSPMIEEDSAMASPKASCTNPVFETSDAGGIWPDDGYFVFNNMWNKSVTLGPQTLYACSYHSWYVVSDQTDEAGDAGAVKSYPNVQMNFMQDSGTGSGLEVPISSLHTVTSTFAETSPHVGIYEDAYDVWLNGVATAGSSEIMVWLDTYNRVPAGSQVTTVTLGGRAYDAWKTSDNSYIALVSTVPVTSGTLDLLEIFNWTIGQGWLPPDATLGQIDFGVEIESTGGANATFQFNDFSITTD